MLRIAYACLIASLLANTSAYGCSDVPGPHPYWFLDQQYNNFRFSEWAGMGTLKSSSEPIHELCGTEWKAKIQLTKILRGKKELTIVDARIIGHGATKKPLKTGDKYLVYGSNDQLASAYLISNSMDFEERAVIALAHMDLKGNKLENLKRAFSAAENSESISIKKCLFNTTEAASCFANTKADRGRIFASIFWTENDRDAAAKVCEKFKQPTLNDLYELCVVNAAHRLSFTDEDKKFAISLCEKQPEELMFKCASSGNVVSHFLNRKVERLNPRNKVNKP